MTALIKNRKRLEEQKTPFGCGINLHYGRGISRAEPGANVYPQTNITEGEYKT